MHDVSNIISGNPTFWQGVLASMLATILIAIFLKLYSLLSSRARDNKLKEAEQLLALQAKMRSSDSIIRVEGYFVALFTLLKYLFIASIFWISSSLSPVLFLRTIFGFVSLIVFYFGLRWLAAILRTQHSSGIKKTTLIIESAVYGIGDKTIDVSKQLNSMIANGKLQVIAGNQIAGDPIAGTHKELRVSYFCEGKQHSRVVPEGEILSLP